MAEIYNPYSEHFRSFSKSGGGGGRRVRKFNDSGVAGNEAPPAKRRRNPYTDVNAESHPFLGSICYNLGFYQERRTENDRLCVPSLSEDRSGEVRQGEGNLAASCEEGPDVYYTREDIERNSPSRRDGIDWQKETYLRFSYVSFLQNLGMRLHLPQTIIATAIVLCHRFFLRRSHASHDRFLIATACIFLVAKSEENPRPLNNVLILSYEICHMHDLMKFHYMLPNDWFEQYKQRVLDAEKMILTTLNFELTVHHPYEPLLAVLNKSGLAQTALIHVAWNLITQGSVQSITRLSLIISVRYHIYLYHQFCAYVL
eukprot:TRINITY_DN1383_c0_g1_i6.p1 TRINITY_DN1383_c0_g1~~TRINITY_DN1383_c0_g1_i6.p1  ORF type:complete len:314 (-),score=2.74 TRINITY_DN1383_c0_g1_i6:419-1360(-)